MLNLKRYTLRKRNKLTKKTDFQNVYRSGKVYIDRFAILYILPNECSHSKVGFAVGKKLGNAVLRNSIKRKMREVFRHTQNNLMPGYNVVWVARKTLVDKKLEVYYQAFERIIKKAQLYSIED